MSSMQREWPLFREHMAPFARLQPNSRPNYPTPAEACPHGNGPVRDRNPREMYAHPPAPNHPPYPPTPSNPSAILSLTPASTILRAVASALRTARASAEPWPMKA